jgi:hypothetical protein
VEIRRKKLEMRKERRFFLVRRVRTVANMAKGVA